MRVVICTVGVVCVLQSRHLIATMLQIFQLPLQVSICSHHCVVPGDHSRIVVIIPFPPTAGLLYGPHQGENEQQQ